MSRSKTTTIAVPKWLRDKLDDLKIFETDDLADVILRLIQDNAQMRQILVASGDLPLTLEDIILQSPSREHKLIMLQVSRDKMITDEIHKYPKLIINQELLDDLKSLKMQYPDNIELLKAVRKLCEEKFGERR